MMYLAPFGVLVSGAFFPVPIAVLLYFLATNVWTLAQQHVLAAASSNGRRALPDTVSQR